MYTISKQEETYTMTDSGGKLLYTGVYRRAPKARRGSLTVSGAQACTCTERLTDVAVWEGETLRFRVCKQPDIRVGRKQAHCQIPEKGLFCDGNPEKGYTIYTQTAALGEMTLARMDDAVFLTCDTDYEPLPLFALAFYLLRK